MQHFLNPLAGNCTTGDSIHSMRISFRGSSLQYFYRNKLIVLIKEFFILKLLLEHRSFDFRTQAGSFRLMVKIGTINCIEIVGKRDISPDWSPQTLSAKCKYIIF